MNQFDWPIIQKKKKTMKALSILKWRVLSPIGPPIYMKGGQHLPKHIWYKWGAMENMLGKTLGTWGHGEIHMGTHWELKGNIVRTHWEPGKYQPHTPNRMGTHWELKGNIVGTHWEPGKYQPHTPNRMGTNWELKGNIVGTHWEPGKYQPHPKHLMRTPWGNTWGSNSFNFVP
jgi:hypothetical protein